MSLVCKKCHGTGHWYVGGRGKEPCLSCGGRIKGDGVPEAASSFDERRGIHLLSPGDVVRFGSVFWNVTGVELHAAVDCNVVTLSRVGQHYAGEPECRVPLIMIERGDVYLRAERKSA